MTEPGTFCFSREAHVAHPVNGGQGWCPGLGKYAESAVASVADPDPAICGHVHITGGTEWICNDQPHPDPPGTSSRWPDSIGATPTRGQRHHYVNRYPHRARAQAV